MKLNKLFISAAIGGETVLVPVGSAEWSGLVRGNRTLGVILEYLKQDTTEAAVVEAMRRRFNAPEETLARDVKKVLAELRAIGALDEDGT